MNTLIIETATLQLQVDRQRTRRGLPAATVVGCCYLAMALTGAQQPWQAEAFVSRGGFGASPPSTPVRSWAPTRAAKAVPLKGPTSSPLRVASTPVAVSMSSTDTEAGPMTGGEGGDNEASVDEKEEQQWQTIYKALETYKQEVGGVEWSGMEWRRHMSTTVFVRAYA